MTNVNEELLSAVKQLSLTVERLDGRLDSRFHALEQEISTRLETVERQVDQIGGGLAVVLNRTDDTKKKLPALPAGYKNWLSALISGWPGKKSELET